MVKNGENSLKKRKIVRMQQEVNRASIYKG